MTKGKNSNITIDEAFAQAAILSHAASQNSLDIESDALEILGGEAGLRKILESLQDKSESEKTFNIFINILTAANKTNIQNLNLKIEKFLALFAQIEDAKNFVKSLSSNVQVRSMPEFLFEIQVPDDCTHEQLDIIRKFAKNTEKVCSEHYIKKFKKIVLSIKEIDSYIKERHLKPSVTSTEKLIDWYYDIAIKNFSEKYHLDSKDAELLFQLGVGPNEMTKFKKLTPKNTTINNEILPDIVVSGDGYFICKLSHDDPRGPFLGLCVGCCQHLGGDGVAAAEYGYTKDNACFYVVFKGKLPDERPINTKNLKSKDIVAECLAWSSQDKKTIVFDSVEMDSKNVSEESFRRQRSVKSLFLKLAEKLVEDSNQQIHDVMVGVGGRLIFNGLVLGINNDAVIKESISVPADLKYTDALSQNLCYGATFKELLKYFLDDEKQKLNPGAALAEIKNNGVDISDVFMSAVRSCSIQAISFALENGADLNTRDKNGYPALVHATYISFKNPTYLTLFFKIIIKSNVSKDKLLNFIIASNSFGDNALSLAIKLYSKNPNILTVFFDNLSKAELTKDEILIVVNASSAALADAAKLSMHECLNAIFDNLVNIGFAKDDLLAIVNEVRESVPEQDKTYFDEYTAKHTQSRSHLKL